ncbi:MAG: alpha/beta hydrolase [Bacteroidales bacterium]|nr:alpha/beta hydrolase [Bacteroidales bacterium]
MIEQRDIEVDNGVRIHVSTCGKGSPIVLLHGHSLDSRMWAEQIEDFKKSHYVVNIDLRGYGLSSPQSEDVPFTHEADVRKVLDVLGVEKAHFVGLSMGAFIVGDIMAVHPELCLSCTLVSGGIRNTPGPNTPPDSAEIARRTNEIARVEAIGVDSMKRQWLNALLSSAGSHRDRIVEPLREMVTDWSAWQATHHEVHCYLGKDAMRALQDRNRTDLSVLFIRGSNEVKDVARRPREMDYLSDGRYVILDDCGHMLNMERPAEFNELVLGFIGEVEKSWLNHH